MIIDLLTHVSGAAWDFSNACIARVIRVLGACSYVARTGDALHVAFHVIRVAVACCIVHFCFRQTGVVWVCCHLADGLMSKV